MKTIRMLSVRILHVERLRDVKAGANWNPGSLTRGFERAPLCVSGKVALRTFQTFSTAVAQATSG